MWVRKYYESIKWFNTQIPYLLIYIEKFVKMYNWKLQQETTISRRFSPAPPSVSTPYKSILIEDVEVIKQYNPTTFTISSQESMRQYFCVRGYRCCLFLPFVNVDLRIKVSNTYCVVFLFCFSWSCIPYVANFSGLSIFDCPFGIL